MADEQDDTPAQRFNKDTLLAYTDGDEEFTKELISTYKGTLETNWPLLLKAFEEKSFTNSVLYSHDFKGIIASSLTFPLRVFEEYTIFPSNFNKKI